MTENDLCVYILVNPFYTLLHVWLNSVLNSLIIRQSSKLWFDGSMLWIISGKFNLFVQSTFLSSELHLNIYFFTHCCICYTKWTIAYLVQRLSTSLLRPINSHSVSMVMLPEILRTLKTIWGFGGESFFTDILVLWLSTKQTIKIPKNSRLQPLAYLGVRFHCIEMDLM